MLRHVRIRMPYLNRVTAAQDVHGRQGRRTGDLLGKMDAEVAERAPKVRRKVISGNPGIPVRGVAAFRNVGEADFGIANALSRHAFLSLAKTHYGTSRLNSILNSETDLCASAKIKDFFTG